MDTPSVILAGLVAMFSSYITGLESPEVTWFSPSVMSGAMPLGETDCGYKTNKKTGERRPFCKIRINTCLSGNPTQLIDTYLHELAHYVDWVTDENWDNHGGQWRKLAKKWDLVSHQAETGIVAGCELSKR